MNRLLSVINKKEKLAVGLMSGTSLDGIDAALIRINDCGFDTKVDLIDFKTYPYNISLRNRIMNSCSVRESNVEDICRLNFELGDLFADAVISICSNNRIDMSSIDFIGSHGQTIYHIPGKSTLQIGEPAVIAEKTGIVTVGDFRVRDVAAGGQGAPLVPFTEYLLYKDNYKTRALQNIGGIGNVTVIPADGDIDSVFAFDTGPGNMMIDACVEYITNGKETYDKDGCRAGSGKINSELLSELLNHPFLKKSPPKTTGREEFGTDYSVSIMKNYMAKGVRDVDIIATFTYFTARSIASSYKDFVMKSCKIDEVIIGGGGSHNRTLLYMLKDELFGVKVMTQEELGYSSDAKEAIAFAILANEALCGNMNNLPRVTGARNPVVMGKILL